MNLLADAIPKAPSAEDLENIHHLHYALEVIEGVEVGLTILEIHIAGALGLSLAVAGPLAGAAAVFVALGLPHAEAINTVIKDQISSGFSRGVVLGADDRSTSFVKTHFVQNSPVPHVVYPEYGGKFRDEYNRGLVAGYAQGKRLDKKQSGAFFKDLFSRMGVHPSVTYGPDSSVWSERTWKDYYIECAAIFRRDHMK
jgi:hypothetical protein